MIKQCSGTVWNKDIDFIKSNGTYHAIKSNGGKYTTYSKTTRYAKTEGVVPEVGYIEPEYYDLTSEDKSEIARLVAINNHRRSRRTH